MIPTQQQAKALWMKYHLPESKQKHVRLVARVATFFAKQLINKNRQWTINNKLLFAAALLHDIDKAAATLPGERHPDTAVRILMEEGMPEVAAVVAKHSLHSILDPTGFGRTWEEKLLFLADKMVKHEIITVDKRFALWLKEQLPEEERKILILSYPLVKKLEKEIFDLIHLQPEEIAKLASVEYT